VNLVAFGDTLLSLKRLLDEVLQLLIVSGGVTYSCGSHDWSSSVLWVRISLLQVLSDVSQSWFNIQPWAGVLGLLLGPCHTSIFIFLQLGNDFFEWEWAKTFDSKDCNVVLAILFSSSLEVIVDLT
jgi:hypothetical protein